MEKFILTVKIPPPKAFFSKPLTIMKKKVSMEVISPMAAGVDIGSKSHFVSIGQGKNDVKEFGIYTKDHEEMISWLKKAKVTTIAMESTGSYWQTLFSALQIAGFEVFLVNGRDIKNVRGKKTDMLDCMWIQKLHSLGLLRGSFLPDEPTRKLQAYCQHRKTLIIQGAKYINKMQKYMQLMNIRLDVAIRDITGKTGTAIIESILSGERDPIKLAGLADVRVKKSKEEIADALKGEWKEDLMFLLKECWELYKIYQIRITMVDKQIEVLLNMALLEHSKETNLPKFKKMQFKKNDPNFNLRPMAYQIFGVDLYQIGGIGNGTVLTLLSTLGTNIAKFPTSKHFVSWLRLAPNNKISGGRIISSRTPKSKNQLSLSLRQAANSIGNSKTHPLGKFFIRVAYKKGRGAAITATARKLAVIIYKMLMNQEEFNPELLENKMMQRHKKIMSVRKKLANLDLTDIEKKLLFN